MLDVRELLRIAMFAVGDVRGFPRTENMTT